MDAARQYAKEIAPSIAKEIRQQIGNSQRVWSWGASTWRYGVTGKSESPYPYPFLQFRVRGFKLRGNVRVVYETGADTYILKFYKGYSKEAYKTLENVYCDDLTEIIDREVETDNDKSPEYAEKCSKARYNI